MQNLPKFTLRLPESWLSRIDEVRGGETRSQYLRRCIRRGLGVPEATDGRGRWDRVGSGVMNQANKAAELRRRARNEKRRQRPKRPKPLPTPPTFVFHPTGQVTSSDLNPLAVGVGLIDDHGLFLADSTRYSEARVRQELVQQMEREPERSWPERFRVFLNATEQAG